MARRIRFVQRVDDDRRIVALQPAKSRHVSAALAVGASIHHHGAIAMTEQEGSLSNHSCPIVRYTVKEEYPIAIGEGRADLPSTQRDAVRGTYRKIFSDRSN